jgi:hypothetical protein
MKLENEFVPWESLIHSLGNPRRIYFLYKQAADSGTRGARLRFEFYKKTLSPRQLEAFEVLFKTARPKSASF